MNVHRTTLLLLSLSLLLLLGSPVRAQRLPAASDPAVEPLLPPDGEVESDLSGLKGVTGGSPTGAGPVGLRIPVAVGDNDDSAPVVAHCASDQYLVVYERSDTVYGQRLTADGDLLGGAFLISSGANDSFYPDVACDWFYNRFVVVWAYDYAGDQTDWDVRARGVWGDHQSSGSQLYGTELRVSEDGSGIDEHRPEIACNVNEHTCLVVFEYQSASVLDIAARRVAVGTSDISTEGSRFTVGGFAADEYLPDVAWGGDDDDYLVTWQYLHDTPTEHNRIVAAYVWDTLQAGSQIQTAGTFLIGPGSYDHDQFGAAPAYNRYTGQYLVVFEYDYFGDMTDYDLEALRLTPGGGSVGGVFTVAGRGLDEELPAVAFSGGAANLFGSLGANQFLVAYDAGYPEDRLYIQAIKGEYAAGSQLDGDAASIDLDFAGGQIDITGSANTGRYLVVWEEQWGSTAPDVLGQMVGPYTVQLPLVLRRFR